MSAEGIPSEWYFITAPQDVSWKKDSVTKEIATYGTNNPYLNYGATKLRSLTLGNAMIEGFSNAMQVEDNVTSLERCMHMVISEDGYAAPYCWQAFAGNKSYGTFIITNVTIKEEMRDMSGNATRAIADISLQEVPPYQVSSGTDITSTAIQGSLSQEGELALKQSEAASQDSAVAKAQNPGSNASAADGAGPGETDGGGSSEAPQVVGVNPLDLQTGL
tara:strand:- start:3290 stop:3946 length:657 start_codon:yes stop_codon:yes gene_type:complete